jgi:hypothetical protein
MKKFARCTLLAIAALVLLTACESNPALPAAAVAAKAKLQFVDLQDFDRELASAMTMPLPKVEVGFYNRITPSALPDRLQRWMAAVEAGGGQVTVVSAPSAISAKSPTLLLSIASSIWSATKMVKEIAAQNQFKAASAFDAAMFLKLDAQGESEVDRVVFTQRTK